MGGYLVSLAAFGAYNYFKLQPGPKAPPPNKPARSPHPLHQGVGGEEAASDDREFDRDVGSATARDRLLSSSEKGGDIGSRPAHTSRIRKS